MNKKRGSSLFLGTICIMLVTVLLTYFTLQSMGIVSKDKMKVEFSINTEQVDDYSKEYDGKEIDINKFKIKSEPELVEGHKLTAKITNNVCVVGDYTLSIDIKIYDENNKDVTDEYEFVNPLLNYSITKRKVKIETFNQKLGDLTFADYAVLSGSLLEGHNITMVKQNGNRTPVVTYKHGSVNENYELSVIESSGEEGNGNNNDPTKPTLELKYKNIIKTYDGNPAVVKFEDINQSLGRNTVITCQAMTDKNILVNEVISPIETTYYVDPQTVQIFKGGVDITNNYNIVIINEYANLIINKAELNIESKTFTKSFDGNSFDTTELQKLNYTGLVGNDKLQYKLINDIDTLVKVGSYDLTLEYKVINEKGLDVTNCYNIIKPSIRLIINPVTYNLDFIVKVDNFKDYDGTELLYTINDLQITLNGNEVPNGMDILKKSKIVFKYTMNNKPVYSIKDAGMYEISIEDATYVDPNISFVYNTTVRFEVKPKKLIFEFTNPTNIEIPYKGMVIDLADYKDVYKLNGVVGQDIVKPTFNVTMLNTGSTDVNVKIKNVGKYQVKFDGIDTINTLNSNYLIDSTAQISTNVIINPLELAFETVSKTIVYDGKEYYVPAPKLVSKLAGNDRFVVGYTEKHKDVGTYSVDAQVFEFYDENGADVTDNYETFSTEIGELIITPRKVKIETETKVLSLSLNAGQEFYAKNVKIVNALDTDLTNIQNEFIAKDLFIDFSKYGVGIYDNTFTKTLDLESKYKNYEFEIVYGKVIVNP